MFLNTFLTITLICKFFALSLLMLWINRRQPQPILHKGDPRLSRRNCIRREYFVVRFGIDEVYS